MVHSLILSIGLFPTDRCIGALRTGNLENGEGAEKHALWSAGTPRANKPDSARLPANRKRKEKR